MKNINNLGIRNSQFIKNKVYYYKDHPLYLKDNYYKLTFGGGIYFEN